MSDDSTVLLLRAGQKAGHVFKRHQWNVEAIAEADETRSFYRGINVERAREHCRLIGHDPNRLAVQTRESDDDVFRVVFVDFKKVSVIDDRMNHVFHVIGHVRLIGDQRIEFLVNAIDRIGTRLARRGPPDCSTE